MLEGLQELSPAGCLHLDRAFPAEHDGALPHAKGAHAVHGEMCQLMGLYNQRHWVEAACGRVGAGRCDVDAMPGLATV